MGGDPYAVDGVAFLIWVIISEFHAGCILKKTGEYALPVSSWSICNL
jgi:hypothetical protein